MSQQENAILEQFRKDLRVEPLEKVNNFRKKFRRQHSIGKYIVDFYCLPNRPDLRSDLSLLRQEGKMQGDVL